MLALNKWTMRHGHLLEMGGITTVDPSFERSNLKYPQGQVLTFDQYKELSANDKSFELPKITDADISDKSKGDFLSKLIAILQTTWFILQCIARGQQKLAITELELVTLALASLNAVTYAFWWHKPLGVQEPIRIYFKTEVKAEEQPLDASDEASQEISAYYVLSQVGKILKSIVADDVLGFLLDPCSGGVCDAILFLVFVIPFLSFAFLSFCILVPFPLGIILLLKILKTSPVTEDLSDSRGLIAAQILHSLRKLRYRLTSYIARVSEKWLRKLLRNPHNFSCSGFFKGWLFLIPTLFFFLLATTICLLPLFTLVSLVSFIFTAVFGIITSDSVAPGATHVPSFYAPATKSDKYSRMVVFAFFGVIFGGLHCIGWNFQYPTQFEQHLWRATSLAITVIPFIVAPIDYILENFELNKGFGKVIRLVLDLIMTILLFVYVPARLSLIAQALALMREQPQAAYIAVDWTQYIPHIF